MSYQLHLGDCLTVMAAMEPNSIDAIVCDPPYGLSFMGKNWDHGVPGVPFWEAALRVAKPGAHLLAFGGTRTHHRLMVAIEDAGWEIRDCLMFLYGAGFPKSKNLGNGWGSALKPAWEPIILARKPLSEANIAANVLLHGTGAINVDGCRIDGKPRTTHVEGNKRTISSKGHVGAFGMKPHDTPMSAPAGRWPANLALDEDAAALLDEQSGVRRSAGIYNGQPTQGRNGFLNGNSEPGFGYGDSGGAARFFLRVAHDAEPLRFAYHSKASKRDRDEGLEGMPARKVETMNGYVHPSEGRTADKNGGPKANHHPTVKPTDLMRWLVRLVTPPGGTVLDPFLGSGSTLKAAVLEGFNGVGIDTEQEYLHIADKRIAHALAQYEMGQELAALQPRLLETS